MKMTNARALIVSSISRPWLIPIHMSRRSNQRSDSLPVCPGTGAEGHGTDAAIDAFHDKSGFVKKMKN